MATPKSTIGLLTFAIALTLSNAAFMDESELARARQKVPANYLRGAAHTPTYCHMCCIMRSLLAIWLKKNAPRLGPLRHGFQAEPTTPKQARTQNRPV